MDTITPNYNLRVEKWIPVLWNDGKPDRVGILEAFTQANRIRQIAASNPIDNVALLRFLLAMLQWCKPEPTPDELARIHATKQFPERWLEKVEQNKDGFDLFDSGNPFYQDPDLPEKVHEYAEMAVNNGLEKRKNPALPEERNNLIEKKVQESYGGASNLIQELPSGSNIAHFRHANDDRDGLCFACCALGLLRWSTYAAAGTFGSKAQMPAGINGATPTYSFMVGRTLFDTILTNWPLQCIKNDAPAWDDTRSITNLGPLRSFTWLPRQILLAPPVKGGYRKMEQGVCVWCGSYDYLVHQIIFRPGRERPYAKKPWPNDPHVLHLKKIIKQKKKDKELELYPSLPGRDAPLKDHAAFWRDILRGLLQRPKLADVSDLTSQTFMMGANKALYQDSTQKSNMVPDAAYGWAEELNQELDWLEFIDFSMADPRASKNAWGKPPKGNIVVANIRGTKAKGHAIRCGLSLWSNTIELALEEAFNRLMIELPPGDREDAEVLTQRRIEKWRGEVGEILIRAAHRAVEPALTGMPLKRANDSRILEDTIIEITKQPGNIRTQNNKRGGV